MHLRVDDGVTRVGTEIDIFVRIVRQIEELRTVALPVYVFPTRIAHHPATAFVGLARQCETRAAETVVELGDYVIAPTLGAVRFVAREREDRASFDTLFVGRKTKRVEHRRHHVDAR